MDQKRMNEIIHVVLVSSTQLAYVEEAYGTLALLENTYEVFKYFTDDSKSVSLFTELEMLKRYIAIHKVRYGDRFSVNLSNESTYKSISISNLSVIDFFDSTLNALLEDNEMYIEIIIELERAIDVIQVNLMVQTDKMQSSYTKEIGYIK